MKKLSKAVYLYNSSLFSIPFLNKILYKIETFLYQRDLLNLIFIGQKQNKFFARLSDLISEKAAIVICRSARIEHFLKNIKADIVLDLQINKPESLTYLDAYSLMWSLVFSNSVTTTTKKLLANFLPGDFSVKKTVVIPYNDSLEVVCDYIFQTAKALSQKGFIVHLMPFEDPVSIFGLLRQKRKKVTRQDFFSENKILLDLPIIPFPIRFLKNKFIRDLSRISTLFYFYFLIKLIKPDYLWCFDPVDIQLVKKVKGLTTTIYDCVDYFTSLDTKKDKEIKADESELIKTVDYFFVNSQVLRNIKKTIREPDAVVVQGFDEKAFNAFSSFSKGEIKYTAKFRKLLISLPKPRIGFIGNLTYRLDFKLLLSLVKKMPKVSFIFIGDLLPMTYDDKFVGTVKLLSELKKARNTHFLPKTDTRKVLRELLKEIDIGMIPYNIEFDFNRYCYPMKLFEYFYMGMPVISTEILELRKYPEFVKIGKSVSEWEKIIKDFILNPRDKELQREEKNLAIKNSWNNKVTQILINLDKQ
ncbi:hypothetical protein A2767_07695 [Candidatus Roizmanbacteria bacterium RIFCSPHIGHO2_01_FULL_35_10]|uniref:Glycosyl transferase family 1 domain-containing protein n=1 Tax=Candidatus Roizmanbacteria bacterium RIFCSPLOWO2_01_FULL_35_13 TaxID=1802055 RepID=A0A1F7ICR1_9BACT|nr:MAG: hypothetical protein A2767_07695 [Candidatus Roizmanbacteria bacterium RIFCSPHIGHO2_01_FULL_35_10]OGK41149.1 MAG: hypothetical protein A3A74_02290 [Candidatus Roizmanbacteria bacterium RIFCSPLOWO2_01_FULL_35_13]